MNFYSTVDAGDKTVYKKLASQMRSFRIYIQDVFYKKNMRMHIIAYLLAVQMPDQLLG